MTEARKRKQSSGTPPTRRPPVLPGPATYTLTSPSFFTSEVPSPMFVSSIPSLAPGVEGVEMQGHRFHSSDSCGPPFPPSPPVLPPTPLPPSAHQPSSPFSSESAKGGGSQSIFCKCSKALQCEEIQPGEGMWRRAGEIKANLPLKNYWRHLRCRP